MADNTTITEIPKPPIMITVNERAGKIHVHAKPYDDVRLKGEPGQEHELAVAAADLLSHKLMSEVRISGVRILHWIRLLLEQEEGSLSAAQLICLDYIKEQAVKLAGAGEDITLEELRFQDPDLVPPSNTNPNTDAPD